MTRAYTVTVKHVGDLFGTYFQIKEGNVRRHGAGFLPSQGDLAGILRMPVYDIHGEI